MRSRCSLYVDVGYLLSAAAVRVTGTSLRNGIHVDYEPLVDALIQQAERLTELPVLRVHWYDSARDGVPDNQQQLIGELPNVKLRLGRFGVDGQQKGVDLRIGLDLVTHARNGAAEVFILVSGDDDLTEAVEEAQVHGVQVVLLAVPNAEDKPHGISRHLIRAADGLKILFPEIIEQTVSKVETPPASQPSAVASPDGRQRAKATPTDLAGAGRSGALRPASVLGYSAAIGRELPVTTEYVDTVELAEQIERVVVNVLTAFRMSATTEALTDLRAGRPSIPRDIDKALLTDLSERRSATDLTEEVRHKLRKRFWDKFDES
jgi:uncharacterized LabA/DUF88 family protein